MESFPFFLTFNNYISLITISKSNLLGLDIISFVSTESVMVYIDSFIYVKIVNIITYYGTFLINYHTELVSLPRLKTYENRHLTIRMNWC